MSTPAVVEQAPVAPKPMAVTMEQVMAEETAPPLPLRTGHIQDQQVADIMTLLQGALVRKEEDEDQVSLVDVLQKHRALLVNYATQQYLSNPKSASLLEGIVSLIGHMEKAVRDDRKERAKKKDSENNVLAFNQMVDAMKSISAGKIALPVFDVKSFILDPTQSLLAAAPDVAPIKPGELVQGNQVVGIDGTPV